MIDSSHLILKICLDKAVCIITNIDAGAYFASTLLGAIFGGFTFFRLSIS